MTLVDHIFIFLLFVVQPVSGYFETRRYVARAEAGHPVDRVRFYRQTAALEWGFLAALAAAWIVFGRPVADLGFVPPGGLEFWSSAVVLVLLTGLLVYSWRLAKRASEAKRARELNSLGTTIHFVPHTNRELNYFYAVSVTAGIVEEIVYRGFVLWYLAHIMPLWGAVVVSSVGFGLAHSYQGVQGAVRSGLVGLAFGILYVVSGSIWLPIIGHMILDVLQGATIHEMLRKADRAPDPHLA